MHRTMSAISHVRLFSTKTQRHYQGRVFFLFFYTTIGSVWASFLTLDLSHRAGEGDLEDEYSLEYGRREGKEKRNPFLALPGVHAS